MSTIDHNVHVLLYTLLLNPFGEFWSIMSEDMVDMSKQNEAMSTMSKRKISVKTLEKILVGAYI